MDAENGQPTPGLETSSEALASLRLGFMALVRLLEKLAPDAVRVGEQGPPTSEGIRFHHDPSLHFHAGDVVELTRVDGAVDWNTGRASSVFHLTSSFLGLTGAVSPLPAYFA